MSGVDARYLGLTANQLADIATDLKSENDRLRELAGNMLRCMKRNSDCADCLVNGEHCEISYIEADALELGIEVPS